jgi:hypothetical protein
MNNHSTEFLIMEAGLPGGSIPKWEIINEASEKNYSVLLKDIMKKNSLFLMPVSQWKRIQIACSVSIQKLSCDAK